MWVNLRELAKDLPESSPELTNILLVQHDHEDAGGYIDHTGRLLLYSGEVNAIVDRFDVGHDDQGQTYVTPYVVENGVRVQCNPPVIYVGNLNQAGFGEIPDTDLEERLEEYELPREMIRDIKRYFRSRAPVNFNDSTQ